MGEAGEITLKRFEKIIINHDSFGLVAHLALRFRRGDLFFPKQCGHTEGLLTVRVKARCLIEVVAGIFPLNFHAKWLL